MKKEGVFLLMISLLFSLFSCKNMNDGEFIQIDLTDTFILNDPEVIYSFTDKYPTDVTIRDSIAYIVQIKSDNCLMALNINTKQIIQSFGVSGHGPNDVIFPLFILSIDQVDVLLEDAFTKRLSKIDFNKDANQFVINKYIDYPDKIFRSGETNISRNFIAGRKVGNGKMFYIYNRNTDVASEIDYYPKIKKINPNLDFNYLYAPSISLNEERNRILAGMYFWDIFHVFDLSGNRIKTYSFSKNPIPTFRYDASMAYIMQKCNVGIIRSFPTKDYCYFLRVKRDRVDNMLIQVNWDGNLINAYHIPDEIEGQFYIDENEKKMYIVRHRIISEIEEVFEIVSYLLQ